MAEPSASYITPHESSLAERIAVIETRLDGVHGDMAAMREEQASQSKVLADIADHQKVMCHFAQLGIVVLKWAIPSGGLLGLVMLAKELGFL